MTGQLLRRAHLESPAGRVLELRVYRPDLTSSNIRQLATRYHAWLQQARAIEHSHPDAAYRAAFAAEVAWLAARELRQFQEERHILVVGVDQLDEVVGINTAYWVPEEQVWYMAVGTTRPIDQPGYPSEDQFRGIGLEIVGALVAEMNKIVCAPVTLEPLDAAARRFWLARGFHDDGEEMRISCPESQALAARLAHSERDDPAAGDAPFFTSAQIKLSRGQAARF